MLYVKLLASGLLHLQAAGLWVYQNMLQLHGLTIMLQYRKMQGT